ncbi:MULTISPECIES: pyridoxal-phosphate dependent enzyme [unclassified Corallococcus]|uniref:pyridoxal-phosphate dependent enzyme n=1 Tax=unclassified Corallococcus TaxID=2685029 RepID=UPI001A8C0C0E|nr:MULTISPECIES: pyridoxal-phosphate dependent enzyme [unclassified Corallococcus]MBN9683371.1 pyridoxal-phosphate dependent enzyme [Corallococcus sp. NCSPR001]WAS85111.1 pyridoxal-phosphate dependent enzyme [Corallococcus sp. NCRR]
MDIQQNILTAIGHTPLVKLNKLVGPNDATVLVKCEFMNPGASIKDRMALYIIEKAEREGKLKPGGTIVENTSGNTGMGVALAAAVKGYKCIFTMPDKMSLEKINRLKAMGAQVVVTPTNVPAEDPRSYYETSKRLAKETPGAFMLNQYHNPDNIEAHYHTTGPEIFQQTEGKFDYFVSGLGTGGTMSGAGKFLKEKIPGLKNIGVDPEGSVYEGYFKTGKLTEPHVYKVEGIGEDMLCGAMDFKVVDDVRQVDDRMCFNAARRLAREEGIFAGGSSGAAVHVAVQLAKEVGKGKTIVVVLPDSGSSYISKFHSDEWMRDNGFMQEKGAGTVRDIIGAKPRDLKTAKRGDRVDRVVETMRSHGISQMPVVSDDGRAVGMVHEYDLLNALVANKVKFQDAIDPIVAPLQGAVSAEASIDRLREIFARDNVAVVKDGETVIAIVTKIDLIDHLHRTAA